MTTSIAVRPASPGLRPAIRLAFVFFLARLLLHVAADLWQVHLGWGYFRDEFYYIACGRHLAWGYVDHGPIVALQARLATTLFGHSLVGIRILSHAAGASRVFLTGILCWALGGRRPAQALAMLAVLVVPIYLGIDSFLSMNSFESAFWMVCLLALILMVNGGSQRTLWLVWGLSAGVGLLNKPSMTFFLIALLAGLLLTPQRRLLFTRWAALGVAVMILIAAPNLLWQIHNHWPTLEFLHNGRVENKNISLGPIAFIAQQILVFQPANLLIWGAGLIFLLRRPQAARWRWIGLTYLFFLAITMALHAKDYYVAPIYPVLFAAGGIAWERRFASKLSVRLDRVFAFPVIETVLVLFAAVLLPMSMPLLHPATWVTYAEALHLTKSGDTENMPTGRLPQFFADRFGWQEEVDIITRTYNALPPDERAVACIWGSNYGEAGAVDFLGHNLPPAMSGQNNYFLWGPHGCTGQVVISVTPTPLPRLLQEYDRAEIVGHLNNPWSMPYEHRNIVLLHNRKHPIPPDWPDTKEYI